MKRILTVASLIAVTSGSAMAMSTPSDILPSASRMAAERLVPNGQFDNLTTAQVNAIEAILFSGDDNRGGQIRSILLN